MPTYAYACTACDNRFEVQQSFTDDSLTDCPDCAGRVRKLFSSVGIVFKGSGFYRTDSRAGAGNGASAGDKADRGSSDKSSDKGTSDKGSSDKGSSDKGSSDKGSSDKGSSDKGSSDKGKSGNGKSGDGKSGNGAKGTSAKGGDTSGGSKGSSTPAPART